MEIMSGLDDFMRKVRSVGPYRLGVKFTKTPVIIFEPMMESYANNPYYNIFKIGEPPVSIVVSDYIFEGWSHYSHKNQITSLGDIEMVEKTFSELMKKYSDEFDSIDFDLEVELDSSLIGFIKKTGNMTREIYYLFNLFIDELFSPKDKSEVESLQKLRMDADVFVAKYVWGTYEKILNEIRQRFDVSDDLIMHSTTREIIDFVSSPDENPLKARDRRIIAVIAMDDDVVFLEEEDAKSVKKFLEEQNPLNEKFLVSSENNSFGGDIGSEGHFCGKVIKFDAEDYNNEKVWDRLQKEKDYVLVTPMTRPELVLYMEKAGAFVTDEGGVTCHAAIIAREMGKPCIVGTGIATRFLQDGDFVEVDANRGIVRVLKRG